MPMARRKQINQSRPQVFWPFDRNGDGLIDDGHELFGPASGGLSGTGLRWTMHRNGWIDENDDPSSCSSPRDGETKD